MRFIISIISGLCQIIGGGTSVIASRGTDIAKIRYLKSTLNFRQDFCSQVDSPQWTCRKSGKPRLVDNGVCMLSVLHQSVTFLRSVYKCDANITWNTLHTVSLFLPRLYGSWWDKYSKSDGRPLHVNRCQSGRWKITNTNRRLENRLSPLRWGARYFYNVVDTRHSNKQICCILARTIWELITMSRVISDERRNKYSEKGFCSLCLQFSMRCNQHFAAIVSGKFSLRQFSFLYIFLPCNKPLNWLYQVSRWCSRGRFYPVPSPQIALYPLSCRSVLCSRLPRIGGDGSEAGEIITRVILTGSPQ